MPLEFTPYSTIASLLPAGFPSWASGLDQQRIASYHVYEAIYWGVPETFRVIQRGDDSRPIYVPSGRQIIETMHRHLAPSMSMVADPELGSDVERADLESFWRTFSRRERFASRFSMNKRYGLIRGDWMFHLRGDPEREEGARLSLLPLDPAACFPIYNEDDLDEVIGWHVVEQWMGEDGKPYIYRLTYRKETERGGPSPIIRSEALYEPDKWGGAGMEEGPVIRVIAPEERLPDPIDSLPIYHIRNIGEPNYIFGSSEMRGLETLMAGINQSVSDEELELALNGLGVYVTDAGSPINEQTGEPEPWDLGPARVVEIGEGKKFERVTGTQTITPIQEHVRYLQDQIDMTLGLSDVAKGRATVEVAESGVALALRMGPIFARAGEQELSITDVMINMMWDLKKWRAAYEGGGISEAALVPVYGDRLPANKAERFKEIMEMYNSNIVSGMWARDELAKIGYEFPDHATMAAEIIAEKQALNEAEVDPFGSRMSSEMETEEEGGEGGAT